MLTPSPATSTPPRSSTSRASTTCSGPGASGPLGHVLQPLPQSRALVVLLSQARLQRRGVGRQHRRPAPGRRRAPGAGGHRHRPPRSRSGQVRGCTAPSSTPIPATRSPYGDQEFAFSWFDTSSHWGDRGKRARRRPVGLSPRAFEAFMLLLMERGKRQLSLSDVRREQRSNCQLVEYSLTGPTRFNCIAHHRNGKLLCINLCFSTFRRFDRAAMH